MRVGVLGPLFVTDGGKQLPLGGPKQRAVFALLMVRPGAVVSVATIVDGVWGDRAPGAVESSLQSYVSRLRSDAALAVERVGDGYRLDLGESTTVDALEFEQGLDQARRRLEDDPRSASTTLHRVLKLWRGSPYSDLSSTPGLGPEIARLESLHRSARELSVDVSLAMGDNESAIRSIDELAAEDPFRESLRSKHMIALYRLGRQAAALSLYKTVRRQLIDELGVEPGPELQAVERQILVHDPALRLNGSRTTGSAPARNPYKGAEAFTERDAADFFGRDREVVELVKLVSRHRLTLLVGPSGSGKSSLARAGLLPALSTESNDPTDWATQVIRPGRQPVTNLENALSSLAAARADERLVIIDQFEEIYSLVGSPDRSQFIDLLLFAVGDGDGDGGGRTGDDPEVAARILLTLRADFFHLPLLNGRLGPRLQPATMVLPVPSAADLARAVDGPAANVGLIIDPTMTAQVVADVEGQASALPLLQFTLTELAQSAEAGRIDLSAYEKHGGVLGAIGQRAAAVYDELDASTQRFSRRIFLNLVAVVDENAVVRRQVRRSDLVHLDIPVSAVDKVLDRFGEARLLAFDHDPTSGAATVEISHEAVLQEWEQLAGWVDDHRQSLIVRRRLQAALAEWVDSGRAEELLPDRVRLGQFQEWASDPDNVLTPTGRAFIEHAVDRFDRQERHRRRQRRLLTGSSAAVAIVMTVLAVLAAVSARAASRQSDRATARALISDAESNIAVDPELAIMLAAEAISLYDDPADAPSPMTDVLRRALGANKVIGHIPGGTVLAVDATGDRLYTRGGDVGELSVWDSATRQNLATIPISRGVEIGAIDAVAADQLIVRLYEERQTTVLAVDLEWDGDELVHHTIEERLVLASQAGWIDTVVSSDGGRLATTLHIGVPSDPRVIEVWDLENRRLLHTFRDVRSDLPAFSPDGRLLALARSASEDVSESPVEVAIIDVVTGRDELVLPNLSFEPLYFSFSPDQTRLAYADQNQVGVVELMSGMEIWTQPEVSRSVVPRWSPDGAVIITGREGLMTRLSATDGSLLDPVLGDRGIVHDYTYVAGHDLLAVAGAEQVTLIDTSPKPRSEIGAFTSPLATTWTIVPDLTGAVLLESFDEDYAVQVVDSGEVLVREPWEPAPNEWQFPVFSRNGSFFAGYVDEDNQNYLWAAPSMDVVYRSAGEWAIRAVADDGSMVALSQEGKPARLVDVETGQVLHEFDVWPYVFNGFFFADDRYLFTSDNFDPAHWRIWDTQSGELVNEISPLRTDEGSVAFHMTPDGHQLVVGSFNGAVMVYSVADLLRGSTLADALVRRIEAHDQLIIQVSVSADNRLVATNSWDEPAKVWDLETGRKVGEFGGTGQVTGAAFHPTEPDTIFVHDNGYVSIHTLDPAELVRIALGTVTRNMTGEECEQYFGRPCKS